MKLAIVFIATLGASHVSTYKNAHDFLKRHHTTLAKVCRFHHASHCAVKRESGSIGDIGLGGEADTVEWNLYGVKGK